MSSRANELISELGLEPHPEGGFFLEQCRTRRRVRDLDTGRERAACTSIYYLLPRGAVSRFHRVESDELWHFYEGDPVELVVARDDGADVQVERTLLGRYESAGARPFAEVPHGCWQAARPTGDYALVGCTVAPGFEFEDFSLLGEREERLRAALNDFRELL